MRNLKISNDVRLIDFIVLIILAIIWFTIFSLQSKDPRALTNKEIQVILKMENNIWDIKVNVKRIADQLEIDLESNY